MNATRIQPINVIGNRESNNEDDITSIEDLFSNHPDLDFKVEATDLAEATNDSSFAGYRAIRRTDNNDVMSIVKERYTPIQNSDIIEPLAEIVQQNNAKFIAGGVVSGGRKAWVQAELREPMIIKTKAGEDEIRNYIIGLIHHDGMGSNAILPFTSRVSCSNQFAAVRSASAGFSIRHSASWEERVLEARLKFDEAMNINKDFNQAANKIALINMGDDEFKSFALKILPDLKPNKYAPEGRSFENKRETLHTLFKNGQGNIGQTRWDAFNAVTEYFDHYEGATRIHNAVERGDSVRKSMERRFMNSLSGGQTNNIKHKALNLLVN
jgi:phage/plasmid-like protein (TIGR03299 family)